MPIYITKKTYVPAEDLSCSFRYWKAEDHTSKLHGYAIGFTLTFECRQLNAEDKAINPSILDQIGDWLRDQFNHKLCVAADDPHLNTFKVLEAHGLCDLRILPGIGCEKFAEHVFGYVHSLLTESEISPLTIIRTVECKEHDGTSAAFIGNV